MMQAIRTLPVTSRALAAVAMLWIACQTRGQEYGADQRDQRDELPQESIDELPDELRDLRFIAVHTVPGGGLGYLGRDTTSIGEFTLRGPLEETLRPCHATRPVVGAVGGTTYFDSRIARIEAATGFSSEVHEETIGRLPDAARRGLMAYDSRRKQLLAYYQGFLYCYDLDTRRWTSRTELGLEDATAIIYAEDKDVLYVVGKEDEPFGRRMRQNFGRGRAEEEDAATGPPLHTYSLDGRHIATVTIDRPILISPHGRPSEGIADFAYHSGDSGIGLLIVDTDERVHVVRATDGRTIYSQPHDYSELANWSRQGMREVEHPLEEVQWLGRQVKKYAGRIDDVRDAERAREALQQLDAIEREFKTATYPHSDAPQVHAVVVGNESAERVSVRVTFRAHPVDLLLVGSPGGSTRWNIEAAAGVRLRKVLLVGVHARQVDLFGADAPILVLPQSEAERASIYPRRERGFRSLREGVRLLADTGVTSAQTYPGEEQIYSVGPDSEQWAVCYAMGRTRELANRLLLEEIQDQRFAAIHRTLEDGEPTSYLADVTIDGPIQSSQRRTSVPLLQVVEDPADGRIYGIADTGIFRVDRQTGAATSLIDEADAPQFESLTAIVLDQDARQLLVAGRTAPGNTYSRPVFYAYDLAAGSWAVRSYPMSDVGGMAVSRASRMLYGLDLGRTPRGEVVSLASLNFHAARYDVAWLSEAIHRQPDDPAPQLISVGEYLVAIVPPRPSLGPKLQGRSDFYVIDPTDGHTAWASSSGQ